MKTKTFSIYVADNNITKEVLEVSKYHLGLSFFTSIKSFNKYCTPIEKPVRYKITINAERVE